MWVVSGIWLHGLFRKCQSMKSTLNRFLVAVRCCLIYADPPYVLDTRTKRHYAHEMKDEQHVQLLDMLNKHSGFVLLSGYDSELYNDCLPGWSKLSKVTTTGAATSKEEVLWLNPAVTERNKQLNIFEVIQSTL